jgi:hypothetical protein
VVVRQIGIGFATLVVGAVAKRCLRPKVEEVEVELRRLKRTFSARSGTSQHGCNGSSGRLRA